MHSGMTELNLVFAGHHNSFPRTIGGAFHAEITSVSMDGQIIHIYDITGRTPQYA
jgi:hypothetical protein